MIEAKIKGLKDNKSPGADGISPRLLKEIVDDISVPLAIATWIHVSNTWGYMARNFLKLKLIFFIIHFYLLDSYTSTYYPLSCLLTMFVDNKMMYTT